MYSPKINEEFIPVLFKLSASKKMPMTKLVNQIIRDYLEGGPPPGTKEVRYDERESEASSTKHRPKV